MYHTFDSCTLVFQTQAKLKIVRLPSLMSGPNHYTSMIDFIFNQYEFDQSNLLYLLLGAQSQSTRSPIYWAFTSGC